MSDRTLTRRESSSPSSSVEPPGHAAGAARGVLWLGAGAAISKGSQTAVLLVLAALLAPSAMGVLAIGSLVLTVTSALTDVGSATALVYWRGDAERAARTALTIAVTFSGVLTAIGWALAPDLAALTHAGDDGSWVVRGLILGLPFYAVSAVSGELLRRDLSFLRRVLPDIAGAVIGTAVSLTLAFGGAGVYSLVIGQGVLAVVRTAMVWVVRAPVRLGWARADAARLLAYGRHLSGANVLQLLMLNVDYLVVAHVLGADSLGEYSLAFRLAYMPYPLVALVICGAAFAYLCRLRGAEVGEAASEVAIVTVTVLLPMYLGMALLAPQLELLGTQWAPAVPVLRWLAGYGLVLGFLNVWMVTLNAIARTRDTFLLNLLHLVLLLAVVVLVVPAGIVAVAIGQAAVVVVVASCALWLVGRHVLGTDWASILRGLGPAAEGAVLMSVVIELGERLSPWPRISAAGLVVIGALALTAYALPVLTLGRHRFRAAAVLLESTGEARAA